MVVTILKLNECPLLVQLYATMDSHLASKVCDAVGHPTIEYLNIEQSSNDAVKFKLDGS